jgi:hypothetical protein
MTRPASKERRARPRDSGKPQREDWEQIALARVARHVAEIAGHRPTNDELGWESRAFERLRRLLKR